ncbi:hypothetical protein AAZX31_11G245400 [Glycine max]
MRISISLQLLSTPGLVPLYGWSRSLCTYTSLAFTHFSPPTHSPLQPSFSLPHSHENLHSNHTLSVAITSFRLHSHDGYDLCSLLIQITHSLHTRHIGEKAQLVVIKNAGHAINVEKPNELYKNLKSFLVDPLTPSKQENHSNDHKVGQKG